jgi:hypothetical protein
MYKIGDIIKGASRLVRSVFHTHDDRGTEEKCSFFVSHFKDRDVYTKIINDRNARPPIEVREIDGERIIYDSMYCINCISGRGSKTEPMEISEEEYEAIYNQQTDIEEYVARKVKNNETFYISTTAEDGFGLYEFQGSTYKRSVVSVIDEGLVEGKFSDVELNYVVFLAKRRGGACNILSKSDFEKWWKRIGVPFPFATNEEEDDEGHEWWILRKLSRLINRILRKPQ